MRVVRSSKATPARYDSILQLERSARPLSLYFAFFACWAPTACAKISLVVSPLAVNISQTLSTTSCQNLEPCLGWKPATYTEYVTSSRQLFYIYIMTFAIQFESAGVYHVGTPAEQMLVSFEELLAFHAGIIGLLEYGHGWRVTKTVIRRFLAHLRWQAMDSPYSICIDSSGPVYYIITNGEDAIRITEQELGSSLFGRALKNQWDRAMAEPGQLKAIVSIFEAFVYGLWKNLTYYMRWRKVAAS
ncbi:hypothetical protein BDQ94DRAFT_163486 [Aspergillus welwitschiae]|uniref:Uncharacterized protein n=1 Tax=Aspergillus welwitschiae TaxID=1341132 RepID=A0A3F3PMJ9_9EURO|nr:hypothetical protein BDQ94DRAFT_163486 [Aspergillus welwitschiae]RDH27586.1 hypothetical protein BDQ94DRAFT_163486 [Aspergillus welwitschiae]